AQGDVQDGPILRHVDLVSPEHGLDALAQAALHGQSTEQRDGLVGDPILGVVEVDPDRLRGQALATARVVGEQRAKVTPLDLLLVILELPPRLARGQWLHSCHSSSLPVFDTARRWILRRLAGARSQRRKPPRKAFALSPARQPGGNASSWWTLPPPRTTSSGSSAAMRRATTSSTSRRHCASP